MQQLEILVERTRTKFEAWLDEIFPKRLFCYRPGEGVETYFDRLFEIFTQPQQRTALEAFFWLAKVSFNEATEPISGEALPGMVPSHKPAKAGLRQDLAIQTGAACQALALVLGDLRGQGSYQAKMDLFSARSFLESVSNDFLTRRLIPGCNCFSLQEQVFIEFEPTRFQNRYAQVSRCLPLLGMPAVVGQEIVTAVTYQE